MSKIKSAKAVMKIKEAANLSLKGMLAGLSYLLAGVIYSLLAIISMWIMLFWIITHGVIQDTKSAWVVRIVVIAIIVFTYKITQSGIAVYG